VPREAQLERDEADVVLVGGQVVSSDFSSLKAADVWIQNGVIKAIGSKSDWPDAQAADEIDCAGASVVPGLIDCHVHIGFIDHTYEEQQDLYLPIEYRSILAAKMASRVLAAGVTTMMVPGVHDCLGVAIRDAIEADVIPGPRTLTSGNYLFPWVYMYTSKVGRIDQTAIRLIQTEDEIRKEIFNQVTDRVDMIKAVTSGEGDTSHVRSYPDRDIALIAELAHTQGVFVVAHARAGGAAVACSKAGYDLVFHADYLADEQVEPFVAGGSAVAPVLTLAGNVAEYGNRMGCNQAFQDAMKARLEMSAKAVTKLRDAGVRVLCGSESGFSPIPHGHWHSREAELFVKYMGLSPLEALKSTTLESARVFRLDDQTGSIEVGKSADVLVVDGDVSKDLAILGNPHRQRALFARGRRVVVSETEERHLHLYEKTHKMSDRPLTREVIFGEEA